MSTIIYISKMCVEHTFEKKCVFYIFLDRVDDTDIFNVILKKMLKKISFGKIKYLLYIPCKDTRSWINFVTPNISY